MDENEEATTTELHSCDICDGRFPLEEMATLGGDMSMGGMGLMAYPAECNQCREAANTPFR